jgi:hypothetical protein
MFKKLIKTHDFPFFYNGSHFKNDIFHILILCMIEIFFEFFRDIINIFLPMIIIL